MKQALALVLILVMLVVTSCHQVTEYPPVGKTTQQPTDDRVTIVIEYVNDIDDILKKCPREHGSLYGCAIPLNIAPPGSGGVSLYRLIIQKPKDFNDTARLAVLGHEVWHALGAHHEGE